MNSLDSTPAKHGHHLHHSLDAHPHVDRIINEEVSKLAPYAGIILTISLIVLFLIRFYILEKFLLARCYGQTYLKLNEDQRRAFVNHHLGGAAKAFMLITGAYPFISVLAGPARVSTPFAGSTVVTLGDILLVMNQMFVAMYIFEVIYRGTMSYITALHHMGTIIIASFAVIYSISWESKPDATVEFIMCYVWGMFDVITEIWPHTTIILYRIRPRDHPFLRNVFRSACFATGSSTVIETGIVSWLFFSLWSRWSTAFKVITPILHIIFSAAQCWGTWKFYGMWMREQRLMREEKNDIEGAVSVQPKQAS